MKIWDLPQENSFQTVEVKTRFFTFTGLSFSREIWLNYPKFDSIIRNLEPLSVQHAWKMESKFSYVKKRRSSYAIILRSPHNTLMAIRLVKWIKFYANPMKENHFVCDNSYITLLLHYYENVFVIPHWILLTWYAVLTITQTLENT